MSIAAPPPVDPQTLLEALPGPLVVLDDQGLVTWANPAAGRLLGPAAAPGQVLADGLGLTLPPLLDEAVLATGPGPHPRWLAISRSALSAGGQLLQLRDATAEAEMAARLQRQRKQLDLVQTVGRLGLWERDPVTLQGRWDPQLYRFWGLPVGDGEAPRFNDAGRDIVPEDREPMRRRFIASLQHPGAHSLRFRLRQPDGSLRHLHSHWVVPTPAPDQDGVVLGLLMDDTEAVAMAASLNTMSSQLTLAEDVAGLVLWRHDLAQQRLHFTRQGWTVLGLAPRPDGLSRDEVRALIHPQDLPIVRAALEHTLSSGAPSDTEVRYRHSDGSWRSLLMRRGLQRDDKGRPVAMLGVALDVTDRATATRRSRTLERRFEFAARAAGVGYWSRDRDDRQAQWSEQMLEIHGLAPDAAVPSTSEWVDRFVHEDDRAWVRGRFQQWLSTGDSVLRTDLRIRRQDGQVRHLMTHSHREFSDGRELHFGIVIDTSAQHLKDLALRRADQRAALAARGAGLGTWEQDLRDGQTHWDAQMWQLRGLEPRDSAPGPAEILAMVHPDDRERARAQLQSLLTTGDAIEQVFRVIWPDGQVRWLASRSATDTDDSGQLRRRIGVNWDVTSARVAERARQEYAAAERASQAKSDFLARMSHELRTPLNAVLGFAQLMLAHDGNPATRRMHLQHIHTAGLHLLNLINDVLDLSSLDAGALRVETRPVSLAGVLAQSLPLLEPQRADAGLALHCEVGTLAVQADPTRLRQVLLNLLGNAIKYNRPGGEVRVTARTEGPQVRLSVADTGSGLSDAQLQAAFEPFNRLGRDLSDIEGSGIGLAIVKSLVGAMGGQVSAHSEVGVGSEFSVLLPAAEAAPPATETATDGLQAPVAMAAAAQDKPRPPAAADGQVVLYIEDNEVNVMIVRELLAQRPGVTLWTAATGAQGLQVARRRPSLVLLDMQLPDMDGLDVLRQLRADPATADLRCIALSANASPQDMALARRAGLADYWTKPLDLARFLTALDTQLALAAD